MFTGIVQELGCVSAVETREETIRLRIKAPKLAPASARGDSIAVNGCCLTVEDIIKDDEFTFTAVPETLQRTNLGRLRVGGKVNLEAALRANGRLGGHIVTGHVDATVEVKSLKPEGEGARLRVEIPRHLEVYVAEKGSLALNGVSLTAAAVRRNLVEVALIPHTLKETNLGEKKEGDRLNLEVDVLARHVVRCLEVWKQGG